MKGLTLAGAVCAGLLLSVASASATSTLYTQPNGGSGNGYASQNDTNGLGNFATTYDNFTLHIHFRPGSPDAPPPSSGITTVQWFGQYFNPPTAGAITAFTISFYADAGGVPGALVESDTIAGNANETLVGLAGDGLPLYSYSADIIAFAPIADTQYWMSIVPDLGFPPRWGWSSGTGGDGQGYQCFFGTCGFIGDDLAFTLNGNIPPQVPEPSSSVLIATGLLGAAASIRRRFSA